MLKRRQIYTCFALSLLVTTSLSRAQEDFDDSSAFIPASTSQSSSTISNTLSSDFDNNSRRADFRLSADDVRVLEQGWTSQFKAAPTLATLKEITQSPEFQDLSPPLKENMMYSLKQTTYEMATLHEGIILRAQMDLLQKSITK